MVLDNNYIIQNFESEILREYDIRGIVGKNLTENTAYTIGRTFGYCVKSSSLPDSIVVGFDGRLSSSTLHDALAEGLKQAGINVTSVGMGPTPMVYFAHYFYKSSAAVMVTGSHNPSEYNGFKMVYNNNPFYSNQIQKLQNIVKSNQLIIEKGTIEEKNIINDYINRILQNIKINKKLKIAWDTSNGAMGKIIKEITAKLSNTENIVINEKIDGTFPNHHPDPTVPKNMEQLINTVIKNKCDIGLAFDGDGDRLGVVDNKGKIVWADQYLLILCKEISKIYNYPKVIVDVKCSKVFFEEAKKMKCNPIMYRTGHSPIKEKMKELNSPLSGEMSGHVCYADDFFGYDDAMYVALRLLRIIGNEKKTIHDLISEYPKTYTTPEIRIDVDEIKKFSIIKEIKERLKNEDEVIDIDGIRIQNSKGWFLIRASNTQNQITCRAEALSKNNLNYLIKVIEEQLSLSGVNYQFTF